MRLKLLLLVKSKLKFHILLQILLVLLTEIRIGSENEKRLFLANANGHEENNVYKANSQAGNFNPNTVNYFFNQNKNWQEFQTEHIFNPDENPDYGNWRGREWRRWMFRMRTPKKSLENEVDSSGHYYPHQQQHRRRHGPSNAKLQAILSSMKHVEVVVIARPHDVLASFTGNLMQYGTKNQAMVWSQWSFPTLIFQKAGRRLRIFDCGEMYIAGRLLNGYPTYLHDFYTSQIRNPLGGHLRFPVNRRCTKIPQA